MRERHSRRTPVSARRFSWGKNDHIALATTGGCLFVLRHKDGQLQPLWVGLLVGDQAVAFDATGKVLQGDERLLEEQFVYVVESSTGAQELLTPAQFRRQYPREQD